MSAEELKLLKARLDVMQTYVNDSVKGMEGDFKKLFDSIVKALNMVDARISAIEYALTGGQLTSATVPADPLQAPNPDPESGKEL